jgi:hypothetical protein
MPHLQIELVPSGLGAMYARFRSHEEREAAIKYGDIFLDDVRISLAREETAARVPARALPWCALIWASPFPVEHANPIGIRAAFAKVGELLEIDPLCLLGSDLTAVRAVVALRDPSAVPRELWPGRDGIDVRITEVVVVRVWPRANFFDNGTYVRYFAPPPPPPFRHALARVPGPQLGHRGVATSPHSAAGESSRFSDRRHGGGGNQRMILTPQPRVLLLTAPPSSPAGLSDELSSGTASSFFDSSASGSGTPARSTPPPAGGEVDEEARWETVAGSARNLRKARGREKRVQKREAARKSARIAGNEAPEYVDAVTKATKRRELRDTLKGCSAVLQAHVASCKILHAFKKPLGAKEVDDLSAAALGAASTVPARAHV